MNNKNYRYILFIALLILIESLLFGISFTKKVNANAQYINRSTDKIVLDHSASEIKSVSSTSSTISKPHLQSKSEIKKNIYESGNNINYLIITIIIAIVSLIISLMAIYYNNRPASIFLHLSNMENRNDAVGGLFSMNLYYKFYVINIGIKTGILEKIEILTKPNINEWKYLIIHNQIYSTSKDKRGKKYEMLKNGERISVSGSECIPIMIRVELKAKMKDMDYENENLRRMYKELNKLKETDLIIKYVTLEAKLLGGAKKEQKKAPVIVENIYNDFVGAFRGKLDKEIEFETNETEKKKLKKLLQLLYSG